MNKKISNFESLNASDINRNLTYVSAIQKQSDGSFKNVNIPISVLSGLWNTDLQASLANAPVTASGTVEIDAELIHEAALSAVENALSDAQAAVDAAKAAKDESAASAVAPVAGAAAAAAGAVIAAKKDEKEDLEYEEYEKGGGFLTVLAVIIAILLIVLLGIILVLNFMPESAIAFKIDSIIENITSHFTAVDVMGRQFLL